MNRKNVFRQVCQNAMNMTRKAMAKNEFGDPVCSYRSPFGPCLIGSLIKDEHYHEDVEMNGVLEEVVVEALKLSGIGTLKELDLEILNEIQDAHDCISNDLRGNDFKTHLRYNLKSVANKHGIPFPAFYKSIKQ